MVIDTVDVLVIGSGRLITENSTLGNEIANFYFKKSTKSHNKKKYSENLSKFMNFAHINVKNQFSGPSS